MFEFFKKKYLYINFLISISISLFFSIVFFILYKGVEFLSLFFASIVGFFFYLFSFDSIFFNLKFAFDLNNNETIFIILIGEYLLYFTIFIIFHFYFHKTNNLKLGYIFTIIFSLINVYFGTTTLFQMLQ